MFDRKPTVGGSYAESPPHATQFANKARLSCAATHVFDYRVAEYDVEGRVSERQWLTGLHAAISQSRVARLQVRAILRSDAGDPVRIWIQLFEIVRLLKRIVAGDADV